MDIERFRRGCRDERGQVMAFALIALVFLLVVGGLAVDLAYYFLVDDEIERSMDAAVLAGAGKLKFSDVELADARTFAHDFAFKNGYRIGTIDLDRNDDSSNPNIVHDLATMPAPYGDIVLGVWDPALPKGIGTVNVTATSTRTHRFEPSTDGTIVNAVMCRYQTPIQTSFLRLWGWNTLTAAGYAIATSNPPATPPENSCKFPMCLSSCPFEAGGAFSSQGCGVAIKFATSSGTPGSTNTAAWCSSSGNPTPPNLIQQITNAAAGNCSDPAPAAGTDIPTNNGMQDSVFSALKLAFITKYNQSVTADTTYEVKDENNITVYNGHGWQVYVPVVDTECNPDGTTQAITGPHTITGWTRMVMTQMWDTTGGPISPCVVSNPDDNTTHPWCVAATDGDPATNPPAELQGGSSRSVFGYYECGIIPAPPTPSPAPRAAIATKLRLVE